VHRAVVRRREAELVAGVHDGDRQVMVDVRRHPGERELDRLTRLRATVYQRAPHDRTARARADCRLGIEIQTSEDDIQALEESRVLKLRSGARGVDR
jgi:hypothetical protein